MTVAVCDDNSNDRSAVRELLDSYAKTRDLTLEICEYESGMGLVEEMEKYPAIDIILLDINMDDMDGLEAAKRIRRLFAEIPIILITAYMSYALDGYKVRANRFLIKDDLAVTLADCMDDILEELKVRSREITLDFDEGTFRIRTDNIIFVETFGHKLMFHLLEQSLSMNRSISDMENTLREYGFVRAHKSYLVNLHHVRRISNYTMKLATGDEVPVPRSRYAQVKKEYATYRGGML